MDTMLSSDGGGQGLPIRPRKKQEKQEKNAEFATLEQQHEPAASVAPTTAVTPVTVAPQKTCRKPGDTEVIIDSVSGKGYTFTLPSALRYKTVMRRRFMRWGESFVIEANPRLRTLMQECVSPQPEDNYALQSWLVSQFQIFLRKDELLYTTNLGEALQNVKPLQSIAVTSPYTGREYHLLIPTASEILRVLPEEEQRMEVDTGDILIELSAYDALLERYCAPAITAKGLEEMIPSELEWLELALYLFLHQRN